MPALAPETLSWPTLGPVMSLQVVFHHSGVGHLAMQRLAQAAAAGAAPASAHLTNDEPVMVVGVDLSESCWGGSAMVCMPQELVEKLAGSSHLALFPMHLRQAHAQCRCELAGMLSCILYPACCA